MNKSMFVLNKIMDMKYRFRGSNNHQRSFCDF